MPRVSMYAALYPRAEAARLFADAEARRGGHDPRWFKPWTNHGTIFQSWRCRRCGERTFNTVRTSRTQVTVEGMAACTKATSPTRPAADSAGEEIPCV